MNDKDTLKPVSRASKEEMRHCLDRLLEAKVVSTRVVNAIKVLIDSATPEGEKQGDGLDLIGEFDNLFRSAHGGYDLSDKEFECKTLGKQTCAEIYHALKAAILDGMFARKSRQDAKTVSRLRLKSLSIRLGKCLDPHQIANVLLNFLEDDLGIEVKDEGVEVTPK